MAGRPSFRCSRVRSCAFWLRGPGRRSYSSEINHVMYRSDQVSHTRFDLAISHEMPASGPGWCRLRRRLIRKNTHPSPSHTADDGLTGSAIKRLPLGRIGSTSPDSKNRKCPQSQKQRHRLLLDCLHPGTLMRARAARTAQKKDDQQRHCAKNRNPDGSRQPPACRNRRSHGGDDEVSPLTFTDRHDQSGVQSRADTLSAHAPAKCPGS